MRDLPESDRRVWVIFARCVTAAVLVGSALAVLNGTLDRGWSPQVIASWAVGTGAGVARWYFRSDWSGFIALLLFVAGVAMVWIAIG